LQRTTIPQRDLPQSARRRPWGTPTVDAISGAVVSLPWAIAGGWVVRPPRSQLPLGDKGPPRPRRRA